MGEDAVERPGNTLGFERLDEQSRVPDLPPSAAAHEAAKLIFLRPPSPGRHLLKRAEAVQVVVGAKDLHDPRGSERTDELLLQIGIADVEAEPFHLGTREVAPEPGALESPSEDRLLTGVAETCEPRGPGRGQLFEKGADSMRTSQALDAHSTGRKVDAAPLGQRLDRDLVALALHDQNRAHVVSEPAEGLG